MILKKLKINSLSKLRYFLWTLSIWLVFAVFFTIWQSLLNLDIFTAFYVIGVIFSVVLPFVIGYYYNVYHDQKIAINELCKTVLELWEDAKELEDRSKDKKFFEENEVINMDVFYQAPCLEKEVSMLYILGFYFDNVKWYDHQLYKLPIDFKQKISELCKINLEIDGNILQYDCISMDEFIRRMLLPIQYAHYNTNPILKEFFEFLISNSDSHVEDLKGILAELNKVEFEKFIVDGKEYFT